MIAIYSFASLCLHDYYDRRRVCETFQANQWMCKLLNSQDSKPFTCLLTTEVILTLLFSTFVKFWTVANKVKKEKKWFSDY